VTHAPLNGTTSDATESHRPVLEIVQASVMRDVSHHCLPGAADEARDKRDQPWRRPG
jgi:hypothetical protein